jgi:glycyl-tRNA synthetase beta chain
MAELLLELFSEEIPARMQDDARRDLLALLEGVCRDAGLEFARARAFATPRRLTAVLDGLPLRQPDRVVERRGPRADAPEKARQGFLRSLEGLDYELLEREEKKGRVLYALVREAGRATPTLLAEHLPELLARFPWPKSMRWGEGELRWVRPLHAVLCLFDGDVVRFRLGGVESADFTFGHRFLAPDRIVVRDFADYEAKLRRAFVLIDPEERERVIRAEVARLAEAEGLVPAEDAELLLELRGLVEWPVVLAGSIDADFMRLPREVLVTSMRTHQRYLALLDREGRLAPRFVLVANNAARDGGRAIVAGNERVLRARLWDARFFWDSDRRRPLEARLPELERVVFHARLGTLAEKVERMVVLAGLLAPQVPGADRARAERAALLAKCDLVTGMVGEFPELQGIMGGHYAREQGEPEEIARAVAEHYRPQGPSDECPRAPESLVVALADRIDTLAGFFAAGITPSGTKDPFALRRAALGIVRLVLENGLRLALSPLFAAAVDAHGERFAAVDRHRLARTLVDFLAERLAVHLRAEGVRHDRIRAVFGAVEEDDLVRLLARVRALEAFLASEDGRDLLVAYRRARNIVAIEERRDGRGYTGTPDTALLAEPEEKALHEGLEEASRTIAGALAREDFAAAMRALAALRPTVDAFFERVRVNVEEARLRENRLRLLSRLREVFEAIADFSVVEETA